MVELHRHTEDLLFLLQWPIKHSYFDGDTSMEERKASVFKQLISTGWDTYTKQSQHWSKTSLGGYTRLYKYILEIKREVIQILWGQPDVVTYLLSEQQMHFICECSRDVVQLISKAE